MKPLVIVVKVGGSLFVQPQFVNRLQSLVQRLLKELAPAHLVLVVGGGPLVDALRAVDRVNAVSSEHSHWAAIRLMDVNAELLQHWWPRLDSVSSLEQLKTRCTNAGLTQFRVVEFLRDKEPSLPGTRLPVGWEVTSDSIAARIAEVLDAEQLILIKSAPQHSATDWNAAASSGVVDSFFPTIATKLNLVRMASF